MDISIGSIPSAFYADYRINVMFDGYKWDLQAGEQSTISDKVVLLGSDEAAVLIKHAKRLYDETIAMETALCKRPELAVEIGISKQMADVLCSCDYNPNGHVRFMRFDFHPTTDGWRVSEVNSDVPAGYPEASVLPTLAEVYFDGYRQCGSFGDVFAERFSRLVPKGGVIAYLHDTHTVEDYQILHYLGDKMEKCGYKSEYGSPSHIKWQNGQAAGFAGIVRYFPVEWMEFESGIDWRGFVDSTTPSSNHPIALLTQSKRLPLVWDKLGVDVTAWKKLLPETKCTGQLQNRSGWIFKPAFGRVGEGINIPGTMSVEEEQEVVRAAAAQPNQWVAQRMFESVPIDGLHLCLGVFVIDREFGGFFARCGKSPKMDADASEIPILVKDKSKK